MIRTYSCRAFKKKSIVASGLLCLLFFVIMLSVFYAFLHWYYGVVVITLSFFLLARYLASYKSLKETYVFPKGGDSGKYFSENVFTRKKNLRGMEVVPIYTEPVIIKRSVTFAQSGRVMQLSITASFSPDIFNLPLYCARAYLVRPYTALRQVDINAVTVLLETVLAELVKEGDIYCDGCAEDRLRGGLRDFGLFLHSMHRTLKSDRLLFD